MDSTEFESQKIRQADRQPSARIPLSASRPPCRVPRTILFVLTVPINVPRELASRVVHPRPTRRWSTLRLSPRFCWFSGIMFAVGYLGAAYFTSGDEAAP